MVAAGLPISPRNIISSLRRFFLFARVRRDIERSRMHRTCTWLRRNPPIETFRRGRIRFPITVESDRFCFSRTFPSRLGTTFRYHRDAYTREEVCRDYRSVDPVQPYAAILAAGVRVPSRDTDEFPSPCRYHDRGCIASARGVFPWSRRMHARNREDKFAGKKNRKRARERKRSRDNGVATHDTTQGLTRLFAKIYDTSRTISARSVSQNFLLALPPRFVSYYCLRRSSSVTFGLRLGKRRRDSERESLFEK